MKLTITWSTNYNGVYINPSETFEGDLTYEQECKLDEALDEMELPSLTWDMCAHLHCFDEPTLNDDQIEQLYEVVRNNSIIKEMFGETLELSFEYDTTST